MMRSGRKLALVGLLTMAVAVEFWILEKLGNNRRTDKSGPLLFVVADTTTDSPGTNLVTRIVTFKAEVGGTLPIALQWKVNKGRGFVPVSATATNPVLVISNALISDTGSYALFATNASGATNTTPVPLVIVEGVD
jgi:hypothetical protein